MIALLIGAWRHGAARMAAWTAFIAAVLHDMRMTRAEIERQYGPLSE